MSGIGEVLNRHHVDLTEADLISALDQALDAVPRAAPLTSDEIEYLAEHGGPGVGEVIHSWDPDQERQTRSQLATENALRLLASSLSVQEVADLVGLDRTRIQKRLTARQLYGFRSPNRPQWRIPRWQITNGSLLPGISTVAPAIPATLSPLEVESFMRTAQEPLGDRSPLAFLTAAGDPELVADLVAELDEW